MDIKEPKWVDEVDNDLLTYNDCTGSITEIYYHGNLASFSSAAPEITIGTVTSWNEWVSHCIGSSVPTSGSLDLFSIKCNGNVYFGPDKYHFAPSKVDLKLDPIRPYSCMGEDKSARLTFKMLGYFLQYDSGYPLLRISAYDAAFCNNTEPNNKSPPTECPT